MMSKKRKIWGICGFLSFSLMVGLCVLPLSGHSKDVPKDKSVSVTDTTEMVGRVVDKLAKLQRYFIETKLKKTLSLSDTQVRELLAVLKESNAKRADVFRQKVKIVDQLERNELHGDALKTALDQMQVLDRQFYTLQQEREERLRAVLNDEQVAAFFVERRKFFRKLFDLVHPFL